MPSGKRDPNKKQKPIDIVIDSNKEEEISQYKIVVLVKHPKDPYYKPLDYNLFDVKFDTLKPTEEVYIPIKKFIEKTFMEK